MENIKSTEEQLDPFTTDRINRIGGNLEDDVWQGLASDYIVSFENLREKHSDGITYTQFAFIHVFGRYEKVLPPHEQATHFPHYSLGYGKHQIVMRLVFVAPDSPLPSAQLNRDELPLEEGLDPFVELYYPQAAFQSFLDAFENTKQILFKVRPYAPHKSSIGIFGKLDDPFKGADPHQFFNPAIPQEVGE